MPATVESPDRVRKHSAESVNDDIDRETLARIEPFVNSSKAAMSVRIDALNREWDVERWLETNASTLALTGLLLGVTVNKKWLFVPGVILPFLLQHAVQGWCPPLPLLRRLGIRTREEIDREKYSLKALRGDFHTTAPRTAASSFAAAEA